MIMRHITIYEPGEGLSMTQVATRLRIRGGALEKPSGPTTCCLVSEAAEHEALSVKHLVVCYLVIQSLFA